MPEQHVPERTCAACRRKRPQPEFVRLTRTPQGWQLLAGRRQGRGSYLCADSPACWQEKKLRRAFGAQATRLCAELARRQEQEDAPATPQAARQSGRRDTLLSQTVTP
ncbi:YlxR family protein [Deinococcus sp. Leaf326]|uniref:YlxR family protein n=1 Tax=Deinococcus sp. Leaf326 TaxID=1736338 RepID=UPI0009E80474|nr:YlxR family protein [Deinococcus sp. Leaf326]